MYRLMKSERFTLEYLAAWPMSSYRQSDVHHYARASEALNACDMANNKTEGARYYVLNDVGQEYFGSTWIE